MKTKKSVPFAVLAAAVLFLATPSDFPLNNRLRSTVPKQQKGRHPGSSNLGRLRAVDFSGGFLMLAATALLITGLEEAASHLDWRGATVLGPLVASVTLWAAFLANSWRVSAREGGEKSRRGQSVVEPVFPWRFCTSRVVVGLLL